MSSTFTHGPDLNDRRVLKLAYTVGEAVAALGIGKTTLYKLIKEGQINTVKIGARTLIPTGAIQSLLTNEN